MMGQVMDSVTNIKDSATQLRELALIAGSISLACKLLNITLMTERRRTLLKPH